MNARGLFSHLGSGVRTGFHPYGKKNLLENDLFRNHLEFGHYPYHKAEKQKKNLIQGVPKIANGRMTKIYSTVWPWIPGQILHKSILCRLKSLFKLSYMIYFKDYFLPLK